ncbi:MAG: tRNA (adenosine(37)-N6)-dimethylallyltransferase MiaA [Betaproteobacteria bacterium]|nr:tRNA (adenosine(37)-N6)-dimethylallyltransferase MiaA [Betaproteobacteria bacterium]
MDPAAPAPPALLLIGPTASGKTALACALADRFPVDILSIDSAMVYRGMDIGTAKPDAAMQARYPHQLIDLVTPEESYSAARFCADAQAAAAAAWARGRVPLLTGGTMLYVHALLEGLAKLPEADLEVRALIETEAAQRGWPALHAELAVHDPQTAGRLAPQDAQRISRALEVLRSTGVPLSAWHAKSAVHAPAFARLLRIGLMPADRAALHARIAERFSAMLEQGLVAELEQLRARYTLHAGMPSMRCVGYRQVWEFLDGGVTRVQMQSKAVAATRQLAKRQMTWMRSMPGLDMLDPLAADPAGKLMARVAGFLDCGIR